MSQTSQAIVLWSGNSSHTYRQSYYTALTSDDYCQEFKTRQLFQVLINFPYLILLKSTTHVDTPVLVYIAKVGIGKGISLIFQITDCSSHFFIRKI